MWTWRKPHPKSTTRSIKLPFNTLILFTLWAFSLFWFVKILTLLIFSPEFMLNLFKHIPKLTAWKKSAEPAEFCFIILNLAFCIWPWIGAAWLLKQTKYPRYICTWPELTAGKFMNLARSSNFVMNADKFYLARFCFKYDGLIFRYIGMEKSTHNHFWSYASTNTSLILVIWSLKLEISKLIKENPEGLHNYVKSVLFVISYDLEFWTEVFSVLCLS